MSLGSRQCPSRISSGCASRARMSSKIRQMAKLGRPDFMDGILVLAPTRCELRKAVPAGQPQARHLGLAKHPDKTFIGRKGFDFPGYHFGPGGLTVARAPVRKFGRRAIRLYEQGPGEPEGSHRLGMYVRRWAQWVRRGWARRLLSAWLGDRA
jgi:hypothetical protein